MKLASALPKDGANGLGAIFGKLVKEPKDQHVVIALVDCSQITENTDDGSREPTVRIVAIEPLVNISDDGVARTMLDRAYERRTGKNALPFDRHSGEVFDDAG